jgi:predicted ribosomally synthesized peptide with SipW-like signal peptide
MQKTILVSLVTIGLLASVIGVGTYAYFSDTETSTGNTLTAGILDLEFGVNSALPIAITDMKPSYHKETGTIVLNFKDNPGRLFKKITSINCEGNVLTEPESVEQKDVEKSDMMNYMWFDLYRWTGSSWQELIADQSVDLKDLVDQWIFLGQYEPVAGVASVSIKQSFHLWDSVTNWAQGDKCTFAEEFLVQQTNAPDPAGTYYPVPLRVA